MHDNKQKHNVSLLLTLVLVSKAVSVIERSSDVTFNKALTFLELKDRLAIAVANREYERIAHREIEFDFSNHSKEDMHVSNERIVLELPLYLQGKNSRHKQYAFQKVAPRYNCSSALELREKLEQVALKNNYKNASQSKQELDTATEAILHKAIAIHSLTECIPKIKAVVQRSGALAQETLTLLEHWENQSTTKIEREWEQGPMSMTHRTVIQDNNSIYHYECGFFWSVDGKYSLCKHLAFLDRSKRGLRIMKQGDSLKLLLCFTEGSGDWVSLDAKPSEVFPDLGFLGISLYSRFLSIAWFTKLHLGHLQDRFLRVFQDFIRFILRNDS